MASTLEQPQRVPYCSQYPIVNHVRTCRHASGTSRKFRIWERMKLMQYYRNIQQKQLCGIRNMYLLELHIRYTIMLASCFISISPERNITLPLSSGIRRKNFLQSIENGPIKSRKVLRYVHTSRASDPYEARMCGCGYIGCCVFTQDCAAKLCMCALLRTRS